MATIMYRKYVHRKERDHYFFLNIFYKFRSILKLYKKLSLKKTSEKIVKSGFIIITNSKLGF